MTIRNAWTLMLRTHEGRVVLADILNRCSHLTIENEAERRVLQQFANQTLQMAGLANPGEFPLAYVEALTGTKIKRKWLGRLLERIFHV